MKTITKNEFDKKIEIEYAYLTYMEHMPENKARELARERVAKEYQVI